MSDLTFPFHGREMRLEFGQYEGGGLAVMAYDGDCEPYAKLSVNMGGPPLPMDTFYLKDWSENADIAAALCASGLIEPAPEFPDRSSAFITASAYRFVRMFDTVM